MLSRAMLGALGLCLLASMLACSPPPPSTDAGDAGADGPHAKKDGSCDKDDDDDECEDDDESEHEKH